MMNAIRSEFRKLFTVRTTYVLSLLGLALSCFVSFWIEGYKLTGVDLTNPNHCASVITDALTSIPLILASIVAILLMAHEYRYNTILYTLSSSNSRTKVLLSKLVAVSTYALAMTVIIAALSLAASALGVHLKGSHLVTQHIHYASLVWRALFYGWSTVVSALVIATIVRSQVGAIVTMFAIPTVELILSALFKHNSVYLPFTGASNAILQRGDPSHGTLSYAHAALVFGLYVLVGWVVGWILFVKRDAN